MTDGAKDLAPDVEAKLRATMKTELRRAMTSTRSLLPADARRVRDESLARALLALPEWERARIVASYVATRGEAAATLATDRLRERGGTLALPRVDVRANAIVWHRVDDPGTLVRGAYGILEPHADAPTIDPGTFDLVLVPGVAFDVGGNRLGLGKGFYDRALPAVANATRIGIAYDFQLVAEIPTEPHDVAMHLVVTDTRVVRP